MQMMAIDKEEEVATDGSAPELSSKKKTNLLVLCPCSDILTFGLDTMEKPKQIPNILAYLKRQENRIHNNTLSSNDDEEISKKELQEIISFLKIKNINSWCDIAKDVKAEDNFEDILKISASGIVYEKNGGCVKKCLCGDEVNILTDVIQYEIIYPIERGHFNSNRSYAQIRTDFFNLWIYAFTKKIDMEKNMFKEYSVVLLVSNILSGNEIRLFVDVLLTDMKFKEVLIHTEGIAATFGQGIPGGCIISIDEEISRICCIDEGIEIPKTKTILPYGGKLISRVLFKLIRNQKNLLLPISFDPTKRPCDNTHFKNLVTSSCFFLREGTESTVISQIENKNISYITVAGTAIVKQIYEIKLGALACIAPTALFYPTILNIPHIDAIKDCSAQLSDIEEYYKSIIEDDKGRVSNQNAGSISKFDEDNISFGAYPLDRAIVSSISAVPRAEVRRKLYTSMLVIGEYGQLDGLADMLERRVLSALPIDEPAETVAVFEGKEDPRYVVWKGGQLLGTLDFGDYWVSQVDWADAGVGKAATKKYTKLDLPFSKVFWLYRCETGTDN